MPATFLCENMPERGEAREVTIHPFPPLLHSNRPTNQPLSSTSLPPSLLLSASPERVAEEEVDDDNEKYPGFLLLLLLEEAQQSLGYDLVVGDCGFAEGVRGRRHGGLLLAPAPAARRPVGCAVPFPVLKMTLDYPPTTP